jgi:hypothetical protein
LTFDDYVVGDIESFRKIKNQNDSIIEITKKFNISFDNIKYVSLNDVADFIKQSPEHMKIFEKKNFEIFDIPVFHQNMIYRGIEFTLRVFEKIETKINNDEIYCEYVSDKYPTFTISLSDRELQAKIYRIFGDSSGYNDKKCLVESYYIDSYDVASTFYHYKYTFKTSVNRFDGIVISLIENIMNDIDYLLNKGIPELNETYEVISENLDYFNALL